MSMFYCNHCDDLCDADDGCEEDPDNRFELICVDCAELLQADAEEAEDRRRDNALEPGFRRLGQ